jgi:MinD superfamily P-loop ATPase
MKRALIHPERCQDCQPCAVVVQCPKEAVFREPPEAKPWVDFYRCSGCMKCKEWCPSGAVEEIAQPCTGRPQRSW